MRKPDGGDPPDSASDTTTSDSVTFLVTPQKQTPPPSSIITNINTSTSTTADSGGSNNCERSATLTATEAHSPSNHHSPALLARYAENRLTPQQQGSYTDNAALAMTHPSPGHPGPSAASMTMASAASNSGLLKQTPEEISASYDRWMKLAADNKINASNSWNTQLIDYFHDMRVLVDSNNDNQINFQKAGYTLDSCVKVYSVRVQSIVRDTATLKRSLLPGGTNMDDADLDNIDDDNEDDEGNANADGLQDPQQAGAGKQNQGKNSSTLQRKSRKSTNTKTVEKEFKNITLKAFDNEFMVDPLFRKTSAEFDEGGARGLLFNYLLAFGQGRLILDSTDAANIISRQDSVSDEPKQEDEKEKEQQEDEDEEKEDEDIDLESLNDMIPEQEELILRECSVSTTLRGLPVSCVRNNFTGILEYLQESEEFGNQQSSMFMESRMLDADSSYAVPSNSLSNLQSQKTQNANAVDFDFLGGFADDHNFGSNNDGFQDFNNDGEIDDDDGNVDDLAVVSSKKVEQGQDGYVDFVAPHVDAMFPETNVASETDSEHDENDADTPEAYENQDITSPSSKTDFIFGGLRFLALPVPKKSKQRGKVAASEKKTKKTPASANKKKFKFVFDGPPVDPDILFAKAPLSALNLSKAQIQGYKERAKNLPQQKRPFDPKSLERLFLLPHLSAQEFLERVRAEHQSRIESQQAASRDQTGGAAAGFSDARLTQQGENNIADRDTNEVRNEEEEELEKAEWAFEANVCDFDDDNDDNATSGSVTPKASKPDLPGLQHSHDTLAEETVPLGSEIDGGDNAKLADKVDFAALNEKGVVGNLAQLRFGAPRLGSISGAFGSQFGTPFATGSQTVSNINSRVFSQLRLEIANRAKRVDVRKLKENIWKRIRVPLLSSSLKAPSGAESISEEDEDEDEEVSSKRENGLAATKDDEKAISLVDVVDGLREDYSRGQWNDISLPFCFVCMLHLANEKGLDVVSNETGSDIIVKPAKK